MNDGLIIKSSRIQGKGIFAKKNFKKGEKIFELKGKILDWDDIEVGSYEEKVAIQIDTRVYLGPSGGTYDFINYSCEPNLGLRLDGERVSCNKRY